MDLERYSRDMLNYYARRVDPAVEKSGREHAEQYERDFNTEGHHTRDLGLAIQRALAGRDVLDLAAGMGQYARFLVRTAKSVLATDASPRALSRLNEGVTHGQDLPAGRFGMMELDAYRPDLAPGTFDGALAVNWFQHMPRERHEQWIARLHSKLQPGSVVLIAINHLSPRSRSKMFSKKGDPNLYEPRQTYDGEAVDVIDNVFSEPDLREIFDPHARGIEYTCGVGYYWVVYETK